MAFFQTEPNQTHSEPNPGFFFKKFARLIQILKQYSITKGLNFAVSPDHIPTSHYIVATEQASWHLPPDQGERLRAEMIGAICLAKPPRSNVSKGERQAIDELKKLKDTVILPADKGKATVVLDKEEYM